MIVTDPLLVAFFQQQDMRFASVYARRTEWWKNYATQVPSNTKQNVYNWMAELPGLREWIGPKWVRNLQTRAIAAVNRDFELTYDVDRNDLEDDQVGIYGQKEDALAEAAGRWPDDLVTDAILTATTKTGFDGQFFFDSDHPVDLTDSGSGIYSNLLTGRPLNQANFNYAYSVMQSFVGESGKSLEVTPNILMVAPAQRQIALEITKGSLIAQLAKNVAGLENVGASAPSNINMGEVIPLINPRLVGDTAGAWYLFCTSRAVKPFIFQLRKPVTPVQMSDPQSTIVFNQRKIVRGVEARGTATFALPFLALKATP
jgi:phage major head subunit gpT-like protein